MAPLKDPTHALFKLAEGFLRLNGLAPRANEAYPDDQSWLWTHAAGSANAAFACELFLKCVARVETGTAPRGHFLDSLFDQLSVDHQQRITEYYEAAAKLDDLMPDDTGVGKDVRAILTINRDSFEKLRYLHEMNLRDMQGSWGLYNLAMAIRRVLLEDRPSLADNVFPPIKFS